MSHGGCAEVVQSFLPLGIEEREIGSRFCMYQYPTFIPHQSHINPTLRAFPMEKVVCLHELFFQSFFLDDSKF
jgi:hypothetical protein